MFTRDHNQSIMNDVNWKLRIDPRILIDLLLGLPDNRVIEAGGHKLSLSSKGRLHSWKWVWDATVKDLTTGIEGSSRHYKSRGGAIEHAVQDLLGKNP